MKYRYGNGGLPHGRGTRLRKRFLVTTGIFLLTVAAASFNFALRQASATVPGINVRASISASGSQSSGDSFQNVISRDGRFVAFTNNENYFVGTDFNNSYDVFVRGLNVNTTVRASVSTLGVSANQGALYPAISETGRYVAFSSTSSNLLDGRTVTSSYWQMYLRDTVTGTTSLLTEVSSGIFANGNTYPTDVSTDGRFVLFRSYATNLGPTITGGSHNNVFLLDRNNGNVTWVNAQAVAGTWNGLDPYNAQMSCDGAFIAFDSQASYLGLPSSSHYDVFLFDRRGGNTLTNITAAANAAAFHSRISCNGNYVGFASSANNLDPITSGMSLNYHGYVYDRINGQFKLVDQATDGSIPTTGIINVYSDPLYMSLSDKGSVAFVSTATALDVAVTSGYGQVYVRNIKNGTTELLTRDSNGTAGDNSSRGLSVSADGSRAAYDSHATNLVTGDTNAKRDIFMSETGL